MTEHLPECWAKHDSDPPAWCICDELRACEARVLEAAVQRIEALPWTSETWNAHAERAAIIAAIRSARQKGN